MQRLTEMKSADKLRDDLPVFKRSQVSKKSSKVVVPRQKLFASDASGLSNVELKSRVITLAEDHKKVSKVSSPVKRPSPIVKKEAKIVDKPKVISENDFLPL